MSSVEVKLSSSVTFVFRIVVSFWIFLDPEYNSGNGAYQEMKAEVTEVPASHLFPDGNQNFTGKVGVLFKPGHPINA